MIECKSIVLTGGSSGIGKAILQRLAKGNGNRILVACRTADSITGYGPNVIPFSCDLSSKEGVDALFEKIKVTKKNESEPARSFDDYTVEIDESMPNGVALIRKVG